MLRKIIVFLAHIKEYVEYYLAVVSALGILWGGFVIYNNWIHKNEQLHNDVKTIMVIQKKQTEVDSVLLNRQKEIGLQLNALQSASDENSEHLKFLETSYVKYLSKDKALSKEDFLKYMEGLNYDTKKNSSISNQNPLIPTSLENPIELITSRQDLGQK